MEKEIQKVFFNRFKSLDVEVVNFNQLCKKLNQANHNPYAAHRIEFYCILIVTKNTYTHFIDFRSYKLLEGSAIFVDKSQVHSFTKELQTSEGVCILFSSLFMEKYYFLVDSLRLNRLFNYHIETPIIHQNDLDSDSFIHIANELHREYMIQNEFAKSEMLRSLIHVLLLKAERVKDIQSNSGVNYSG